MAADVPVAASPLTLRPRVPASLVPPPSRVTPPSLSAAVTPAVQLGASTEPVASEDGGGVLQGCRGVEVGGHQTMAGASFC